MSNAGGELADRFELFGHAASLSSSIFLSVMSLITPTIRIFIAFFVDIEPLSRDDHTRISAGTSVNRSSLTFSFFDVKTKLVLGPKCVGVVLRYKGVICFPDDLAAAVTQEFGHCVIYQRKFVLAVFYKYRIANGVDYPVEVIA